MGAQESRVPRWDIGPRRTNPAEEYRGEHHPPQLLPAYFARLQFLAHRFSVLLVLSYSAARRACGLSKMPLVRHVAMCSEESPRPNGLRAGSSWGRSPAVSVRTPATIA